MMELWWEKIRRLFDILQDIDGSFEIVKFCITQIMLIAED